MVGPELTHQTFHPFIAKPPNAPLAFRDIHTPHFVPFAFERLLAVRPFACDPCKEVAPSVL